MYNKTNLKPIVNIKETLNFIKTKPRKNILKLRIMKMNK